MKRKADDTVERFKARLVATGYNQVYGVDHINSFPLVAKMVTVRFLFALATIRQWELHQLDVNNALCMVICTTRC